MKAYCKINTMFMRDTDPAVRKISPIIPEQWSMPELEYLATNIWYFTEKVDGTNIRVNWLYTGSSALPTVQYGGRTDDAQISTHILRHLDATFRTPEGMGKLTDVFPPRLSENERPMTNVILYGEGFGDKVNRQGSRSYLPGAEFVLFDVEVLTDEGWLWLTRPNVVDVAAKLGLPVVPIVGEGTLFDAAERTKMGFASQWGDFDAEGLVCKPFTELQTRRGERIITKIKAKDYADLRRLGR